MILMVLEVIADEELPEILKSHLLPSEKVHYFSYIAFKGGCWGQSNLPEHWIALTNKRVLYKSKVIEETTKVVEKEGILPLDKISFIEVTDVKDSSGCGGCNSTNYYELRISTSGGTIRIPLPTKEKGYEIRKKFSEVVEENEHKTKKSKKKDEQPTPSPA